MHRGTSKWGETTLKLWLFFLNSGLSTRQKIFFHVFFNQSFPYQFFFYSWQAAQVDESKKRNAAFFSFHLWNGYSQTEKWNHSYLIHETWQGKNSRKSYTWSAVLSSLCHMKGATDLLFTKASYDVYGPWVLFLSNLELLPKQRLWS